MLMTLSGLINQFDLKITGVVHVGAHTGEEAVDYANAGITTVWWIEGNPDIIPMLQRNVYRYDQHVVCALITDVAGEQRKFNVTNLDSLSSSVFEFGTHARVSPDMHWVEHKTLTTSTLDEVVSSYGVSGCNFLNMDLQGAEMLALRGATLLLERIDYIFCEINVDELYIGCARLPELDAFLWNLGYDRVATHMAGSPEPGPGWVGWGDALYVKGRK